MYTATTPQTGTKVAYNDETATVQARLYKNLKLWSFYADLEESFGTFKTCKAVYDRIVDLRIATPQIIMNYALFLEENQYFEESFKAYEKGISLFKWPYVFDMWNTYLSKFLERYGGEKIERARDLFEQCLDTVPPKYAKNFYLLYAKLEEKHGSARRAMNIYEKATKAVDKKDQYQVSNHYNKLILKSVTKVLNGYFSLSCVRCSTFTFKKPHLCMGLQKRVPFSRLQWKHYQMQTPGKWASALQSWRQN